jgi:hypothetical protein
VVLDDPPLLTIPSAWRRLAGEIPAQVNAG